MGDDYEYEYRAPVQSPIQPPYEKAVQRKHGESQLKPTPLANEHVPDVLVVDKRTESTKEEGYDRCYSYEEMMTNIQYLNINNKQD